MVFIAFTTLTNIFSPKVSSKPMLAGNVVALLSPSIYIALLTYTFDAQNHDHKPMALVRLANDLAVAVAVATATNLELIPGTSSMSDATPSKEQKEVMRASFIAEILTGSTTLSLLILWSMPKVCMRVAMCLARRSSLGGLLQGSCGYLAAGFV